MSIYTYIHVYIKVWDDVTLRRNVGATVLLHKREDGSFDELAAVVELAAKYGIDESRRPIVIDLADADTTAAAGK